MLDKFKINGKFLGMDQNEIIEKSLALMDWLRIYHNHKVIDIEKIPQQGSGILATNHSLATYDGFLLGAEIYRRRGRMIRGLGDDLLFKIPLTKKWAEAVGIVPANPGNAKRLLREGDFVGLAPGGMREALRPEDERYKLRWDKRKGFIRLAVETGEPVYLAACPKADDIFSVYNNFLTAKFYKNLKFPLPLFRGIGPSLLPRQVELTHVIGGPYQPPQEDPFNISQFNAAVDEFHEQIVVEMEKLMALALTY